MSEMMINFNQNVNKNLQLMENRLLNLSVALTKIYGLKRMKNPRQNSLEMQKV